MDTNNDIYELNDIKEDNIINTKNKKTKLINKKVTYKKVNLLQRQKMTKTLGKKGINPKKLITKIIT